MKKNKQKQPLQLLQILMNEKSCDVIQKMVIGYCLMMPMNEPQYNEKLQATVEFLEECLTQHPGAFAAYFRILDKLPATLVRHVPEGLMTYVAANLEEVEKYYEGRLPDKYRPKLIETPVSGGIVNAQGQPISSSEPIKLDLI